MKQSESINELITALAKAQGQIKAAMKDATNPHFKSKYADLSAVWQACREPLSSNGLAILQTIGYDRDQEEIYPYLLTTLAHSSGQYIQSICPLMMVQKTAQGFGSALTYMRRYALSAIVGIAADDDDGNAASAPAPEKKISTTQLDELDDLIGEDEIYRKQLMDHLAKTFKIYALKDIPESMYSKVLQGAKNNFQTKQKQAEPQANVG